MSDECAAAVAPWAEEAAAPKGEETAAGRLGLPPSCRPSCRSSSPPLADQQRTVRSLAALLERYLAGGAPGRAERGDARPLIARCRCWAANCDLDERDAGPGAPGRPAGGASTPAEVERQLRGLRDQHRARVEARAAWDRGHAAIAAWFGASARDRAAREEKKRRTQALGPTPARPPHTEALLALAAEAAGPREGGADLPLLAGAAAELHALLYGADRLTLYDSRFEDSALARIPVADAVDRSGRRVGEGALAALARILAGSGDPAAVEAVCRLGGPEWAGLPAAVLAALRPALLEGDGGWLLRGGDPSAMPPWWREGLARTHFRLGGGSLRGPGRYQELVGCAQLRALAAFQALAERRGAPGEDAGGEGAGGPAPSDLGRLWVSDHRAFLEFVADPEAAAEGVARALEGLAAWAGQWWERAPRLAECADAVRSLGLGFGFGAKPGPRGCEVEALARRLRDPFHCSFLSDGKAQDAVDLLREALRAARFLAAGPAAGEGAAGEGAAGEGAA